MVSGGFCPPFPQTHLLLHSPASTREGLPGLDCKDSSFLGMNHRHEHGEQPGGSRG